MKTEPVTPLPPLSAEEIAEWTRLFVPGEYAKRTTAAQAQDDFYSGSVEGRRRTAEEAVVKLLAHVETQEARIRGAEGRVASVERVAETYAHNIDALTAQLAEREARIAELEAELDDISYRTPL